MSSYLRAILTLASGQMLAAVIPFLAAPIMGRIYRPEDYGMLAAYTAIVLVVASVVTLHYQHGVLVEQTDRRAHQVGLLALAATVGVSLLVGGVAFVVFLVDPFGSDVAGHRYWFLLLPVSTMVTGVSLVAMAVANRARTYRLMAIMQFSAATASALSSIAFGLAGLAATGLFLGYLISQAVTLGFCAVILMRHEVLRHRTSMRQLRTLAVRHRGYPLFTLPSSFIRAQAEKSPDFTLISMGATDTLGSYSRAMQLLIMPVLMITTSVSKVYFRNASEDYRRDGNCIPILRKTTLSMLLVGAIPFGLLWLFAEPLFTFYLGENWGSAGTIARILVPMLYLQFALQPANSVYQFAGKQRYALALNVVYLLLVATGIGVALVQHGGALAVIQGFVAGASVGILLHFIFAARQSRGGRTP